MASGEYIPAVVGEFAARLPRFPDGRIDYSRSDVAPVVSVFVEFRSEILLLRRSGKVGSYCGKWNAVAGYIDELRPLREIVLKELAEEVGVKENLVSELKFGKPYRLEDLGIGKTWLVHPAIARLKKKPRIKLDYEHTEYKWIKPEEISGYDTVPNLEKSLENALAVG